MKEPDFLDKLADLNPCVAFIVDNYDILCAAHDGKTVLVLNGGLYGAHVAKVFDTMVEAAIYTRAMDMAHLPYAMKTCNGAPVGQNFTFSIGCKKPD